MWNIDKCLSRKKLVFFPPSYSMLFPWEVDILALPIISYVLTDLSSHSFPGPIIYSGPKQPHHLTSLHKMIGLKDQAGPESFLGIQIHRTDSEERNFSFSGLINLRKNKTGGAWLPMSGRN